MCSGLFHEIRNPLHNVLCGIEVLNLDSTVKQHGQLWDTVSSKSLVYECIVFNDSEGPSSVCYWSVYASLNLYNNAAGFLDR